MRRSKVRNTSQAAKLAESSETGQPPHDFTILHIAGVIGRNGLPVTGVTMGGGEVMLYQMLAHSKDRAHQEVLTFYNKEEMQKRGLTDPRGEIGRLIEDTLGIKVHCLEIDRPLASPENSGTISRYIGQLKNKPNIIHTWLQHARKDMGTIVVPPLGAAMVWELQDGDPNFSLTLEDAKSNVRFARTSKDGPKAIICCSQSCADNYARLGYPQEKMSIIENMVPTAQFAPDAGIRTQTRRELNLPEHAFVIGMAGQHIPRKDFPTFLKAAKTLCDERKDVYFLLCGREVTKDNPRLQEQIKALGIPQDRLRVVGLRDMRRIYPALDIYTQTSKSEGLSVALLEAGSSGNLLVATDVGGTRHAIERVGTIIPPENSAALVAAWKDMLDHPPSGREALSAATRDHICAHYDINRRVDMYFELYRHITQNRGISGKKPFVH